MNELAQTLNPQVMLEDYRKTVFMVHELVDKAYKQIDTLKVDTLNPDNIKKIQDMMNFLGSANCIIAGTMRDLKISVEGNEL